MSIGELVIIGIIILLVVPPEKLPGLARDIGRFLNDIRRNTSGVWEELKKDVPNPAEELKKQKQEAEEYLKFIGSDGHHGHGPLDQSHLDPVVNEVYPTIHTPAEPTQVSVQDQPSQKAVVSEDLNAKNSEDKKPKSES